MNQKPETVPQTDKPPKAHDEGLKGVFHGSDGHGPNQPVAGPATTEQRLREFLGVSMEVSYDKMVNDLIDHSLQAGAELDGLRLGK